MDYKDYYNDKDLIQESKRDLVIENLFAKAGINFAQKAINLIGDLSPPNLEKWFNQWFNQQQQDGLGWTKAIPECPCKLEKNEKGWINPNPDEFQGPLKVQDPSLHPGATAELRGKGETGEGQQCCYDKDGKLMTHGFGAGTADKVSPAKSVAGHFKQDVLPFFIAFSLDGNKHGRNVAKYISVRPPNAGKSCEINKGNGFQVPAE